MVLSVTTSLPTECIGLSPAVRRAGGDGGGEATTTAPEPDDATGHGHGHGHGLETSVNTDDERSGFLTVQREADDEGGAQVERTGLEKTQVKGEGEGEAGNQLEVPLEHQNWVRRGRTRSQRAGACERGRM